MRPLTHLFIPLRLGRGGNNREHHFARAKRVRSERFAVGLALRQFTRPETPCTVLLTRYSRGAGLDDDNLSGSLKSVRDACAEWLGIDDGRTDLVRYVTGQRIRQPHWGVEIHVSGGLADV